MSIVMEEDVKRWTARRKSALVLEIIQGKTTVAEAARAYDLAPSEIEEWVDQGKAGMENRGGSVCLNSLLGPDKWMTAFVMLPAGLPAAC